MKKARVITSCDQLDSTGFRFHNRYDDPFGGMYLYPIEEEPDSVDYNVMAMSVSQNRSTAYDAYVRCGILDFRRESLDNMYEEGFVTARSV